MQIYSNCQTIWNAENGLALSFPQPLASLPPGILSSNRVALLGLTRREETLFHSYHHAF